MKRPGLGCIIQTRVIFLTQLQIPLLPSCSETADRYDGLVYFNTSLSASLWVVCVFPRMHESAEAMGIPGCWVGPYVPYYGSLHVSVSALCCLCSRPTQTSVGTPGSWMHWELWRTGGWNALAGSRLGCPSTTTEEPSPAERSWQQSSRDPLGRAFELMKWV